MSKSQFHCPKCDHTDEDRGMFTLHVRIVHNRSILNICRKARNARVTYQSVLTRLVRESRIKPADTAARCASRTA